MRRVVYHQHAVPPKQWLVWAALLWDRIIISPILEELFRQNPDEVESNPDCFSLMRIINETDICETKLPDWTSSHLPAGKQKEFDIYWNNAIRCLDHIIEKGDKNIDKGIRFNVTFHQRIEISTKLLQLSIPNRYYEAYPNIDFFFDKESSFRTVSNFHNDLLVSAIETFVPINPDNITTEDLLSFRESTHFQRSKFRTTIEKVLNDLSLTSTQDNFNHQLKNVQDILREQVDLLDITYRQYKVKTAKKVVGISFAVPAALQALSSLLNMPIFEPAAFLSALSLASADILATREKCFAEINTSPWGYLMSLKKLRSF